MHVLRVIKESLRVVSTLISSILGLAVRWLLFPKGEIMGNQHRMLAEDDINVY